MSAADRVEAGAPLAILEAMKMEHTLTAPRAAEISEVLASEADQVEAGALLFAFATDEEPAA